jgi:hypothetical protein
VQRARSAAGCGCTLSEVACSVFERALMADLAYVGLMIAGFAVLAFTLRGLERL